MKEPKRIDDATDHTAKGVYTFSKVERELIQMMDSEIARITHEKMGMIKMLARQNGMIGNYVFDVDKFTVSLQES